jgi:hypothetical protein
VTVAGRDEMAMTMIEDDERGEAASADMGRAIVSPRLARIA